MEKVNFVKLDENLKNKLGKPIELDDFSNLTVHFFLYENELWTSILENRPAECNLTSLGNDINILLVSIIKSNNFICGYDININQLIFN